MAWENNGRLKLMVVDDEPDNLDLLYRTFRREFEVFKASNGFEALEMLSRVGEMAVIISDQRMPRMNGTEFLSRTVDQFPDTIRIVLTGYTDVEDLVEAINSGKVFKYITKPWSPDYLRSVVMQAADIYRVVKQRTYTLTQALKRESFFHEVMSAIRESLEYDHILQAIATTLGKSFDADYSVLQGLAGDQSTVTTAAFEASFTYAAPTLSVDRSQLDRHSLRANRQASAAGRYQIEILDNFSTPITALTIPLSYQQLELAVITLYQVDSGTEWPKEALQLINGIAEQMALAISQARLHQRIQAQTQKMQAELEVARQIQTNLLRQQPPDTENARIQARCLPAREVGGDFFEVFAHPQGDIWLAVGDVSGKGVPAALFMASAISVLRRELSQEVSPAPEKVMQNLNQSLSDDLISNNCFITMVLVRYEPTTRHLSYANAGHIYPLAWSPDVFRDKDYQPMYLTTRGVPLGILPVWQADAGELSLSPGSTLLLVSDGLTEATVQVNPQTGQRTMLRQAGLWQLIQQQPSPLDLDKLLKHIQVGCLEQEDDQTVLLLEVM